MTRLGRVLLPIAMLAWLPCLGNADIIGQLTDPPNVAVPAFLDIVAAQIEQVGGQLTFDIETRDAIPPSLPANELMTFLWLVDADNNPETGQPHGALGSEFNVRATLEGANLGGFVDVTGNLPGGGGGNVTINADHIRITVWLGQIAGPPQFHWRCDSFYLRDGQWVAGNGETEIAEATTLSYTPPARVAVTIPLLMLSPVEQPSGQLAVEVRDAAGNVQPIGNYVLTFHSTNDAVATVDANGLVTAHAVPVYFNDTPYIEVWADGLMADNAALIRVTAHDLHVVHQTTSGEHVSYYCPATMDSVDLAQIMQDYQIVEATDVAYTAQQAGVGTRYVNDGRQYLVLDVSDDPATVPCGISGNPIRLGWLQGQPINNSCLIINVPEQRTPQWFVIFHELGHNFSASANSFNLFVAIPSSTQNVTYNEGFASLDALWCWYVIHCNPGALGALARQDIESHLGDYMSNFRASLANYQATGAHYADLDANVLDGILCVMYDEYGPRTWFDLFSTFLPPNDPLPCPVDTEARQATWFVAALSASTGVDLRSRFGNDYGFPLDQAAWPTILACVQARIAARPWQPYVAGDLNCDGRVDFGDIDPFVLALSDPAGYQQQFPNCDILNGDCNFDGVVNFADIDPFVTLLGG